MPSCPDLPIFITDRSSLSAADAVAALIVLEDGRYLAQLRDNKPGIWYPDHWGCFGGAVDPGETPEQAFRRELMEEIGFAPDHFEPFVSFDFDLRKLGQPKVYRHYYVVQARAADVGRLTLMEGREVKAWDAATLLSSQRVIPYDAFGIWLHYSRQRLDNGARAISD
ncbi:MAG: NUDIX domain-containing protein [Rhodospirillaceae bacterium]